MSKELLYGAEAREKLKIGVDKLANAVKITLGPKGRNVAIDKGFGVPQIINDGVSIAREIELEDRFENLGAQLVQEVATKTNDLAGDGTTTATLLTQAIVSEGLKNVTAGISPVSIRKGIEKGTKAVVEYLENISKKVETDEEIVQVASISANDEDMGREIANAIKQVGKDGVITVEESQYFGMKTDIIEGMQFDKGYISPYMVTNNEKMTAEYSNALILITDKVISSVPEILPLLEKIAKSGKKDLVIICDDCNGEALSTFIMNKMRGAFNVVAIKSPGFGDSKKDILEDIAILTGGIVITDTVGKSLETVELNQLGNAEKVIVSKDSTAIIGGKGNIQEKLERLNILQARIEETPSPFEKEAIQQRIAKLTGGVAVIKIGAATETEMKDLKLRIEDAINATKAATRKGIVAGGGVALFRAVQAIESLKYNGDEQTGVEILMRALIAPIKQIAENAGVNGEVVMDKIKDSTNINYGYNAQTDEYGDMLDFGVVDPTEVTITALQNASSVSAMLLTTEVAIVEKVDLQVKQ